MSARISVEEHTRQLLAVTAILQLGLKLAEGDLDAYGRQLGRAIDLNPDLESGLLDAAAQAMNVFMARFNDDRNAKAKHLKASLNKRLARLASVASG